ncbi:MAG: FecR domain-containing protein [Polyangiaceae bacterium]|nr:FecR domain-containing protein [Polyangiaceae bacterium]
MSRRPVPRIAPSDLRDHATEERIARVWDRLENDLGGLDAPAPRRSGMLVALAAAAFAAFGGGLLLGKAIWSGPMFEAPPAVASHDLPAVVDVLAAGTQGRTFQLPGGGQVSLAPGTTIEVEQSSGGAVTLRLVQGEASFDTAGGARTAALAIVAGEARLATAAGSVLQVRHNVDDIDVNVTDGSVRLTSPAGSQELGRGDRADRVPIRQRTTMLAPPSPAPIRVAPQPRTIEAAPVEPPAQAVAAPDWRTRYNAGDEAEALSLLRQQSGGIDGAIASAKTAKELMDLSDLLRGKGGDQGAAIQALRRVVDAFPTDANAQIAAYTLGNMYERSGEQALAAEYFERARSLSPEGNLAEDSFCKRMRTEAQAGHKDEASRMAQEYVTKYPDGRCKDEAQRIISGEGDSEGEAEPAQPERTDAPAAPDASAAP